VERVPWLAFRMFAMRVPRGPGQVGASPLLRSLLVMAPAVVLLLIFAALFSRGNLVFHDWLENFGRGTWKWLAALDVSGARIFFWFFIACVALAFLRPHSWKDTPGRALGTWRRADANLAWKQNLVVLLSLNALFAVVNTIDGVQLWMHDSLPEGIDHKAFLHAGVNNLIAATVLAAAVLATMFQQQPEITRSRLLRGLAYLWIVQNLVLAASVYRRDYFYVMETNLLTEKRVYVLCFLGLVVVGYFFLALHVTRGGGLARLVRRNVAAAFILFYAMQFIDVGGMVSRWCAAKSIADFSWRFDVKYWSTQGHTAWPAILAVAQAPEGHPQREEARRYVAEKQEEENRTVTDDWRSWQWLEAKNRRELLAAEAAQ
jgi:hypothetical protein